MAGVFLLLALTVSTTSFAQYVFRTLTATSPQVVMAVAYVDPSPHGKRQPEPATMY